MNHVFKPTTEERYYEMLEILPPAIMDGKGFMVGEPYSHRQCTVTGRHDQPTFAAFFVYGNEFFEAEKPMTIAEYKAITPDVFHQLVRSAGRPTSITKQQEPQP